MPTSCRRPRFRIELDGLEKSVTHLPSADRAAPRLPPVSPRCAAGGTLVNGPLRQRQPRRDIGEYHTHASTDADPLDLALRREHAVWPRQVADHAQSLLLRRLAALGVQFDQQHEIWCVLFKRRLNGVVDLGVGMHGAAALDGYPFRVQLSAPRARGRRRVAEQLARGASLQTEIVLRAIGEVVEVRMVEIVDLERHAEIVRGYHFLTVFSSHLRAFRGKRECGARCSACLAKTAYPRPRV